jgi:alpha-tubulin suppressor-like RCC1 family protein
MEMLRGMLTTQMTARCVRCTLLLSLSEGCGSVNLTADAIQIDGVASPIPILGLTNINAVVSRNGTHACGVDAKDDVYCWGSNYNGESGPRASSPQRIDGLFK